MNKIILFLSICGYGVESLEKTDSLLLEKNFNLILNILKNQEQYEKYWPLDCVTQNLTHQYIEMIEDTDFTEYLTKYYNFLYKIQKKKIIIDFYFFIFYWIHSLKSMNLNEHILEQNKLKQSFQKNLIEIQQKFYFFIKKKILNVMDLLKYHNLNKILLYLSTFLVQWNDPTMIINYYELLGYLKQLFIINSKDLQEVSQSTENIEFFLFVLLKNIQWNKISNHHQLFIETNEYINKIFMDLRDIYQSYNTIDNKIMNNDYPIIIKIINNTVKNFQDKYNLLIYNNFINNHIGSFIEILNNQKDHQLQQKQLLEFFNEDKNKILELFMILNEFFYIINWDNYWINDVNPHIYSLKNYGMNVLLSMINILFMVLTELFQRKFIIFEIVNNKKIINQYFLNIENPMILPMILYSNNQYISVINGLLNMFIIICKNHNLDYITYEKPYQNFEKLSLDLYCHDKNYQLLSKEYHYPYINHLVLSKIFLNNFIDSCLNYFNRTMIKYDNGYILKKYFQKTKKLNLINNLKQLSRFFQYKYDDLQIFIENHGKNHYSMDRPKSSWDKLFHTNNLFCFWQLKVDFQNKTYDIKDIDSYIIDINKFLFQKK